MCNIKKTTGRRNGRFLLLITVFLGLMIGLPAALTAQESEDVDKLYYVNYMNQPEHSGAQIDVQQVISQAMHQRVYPEEHLIDGKEGRAILTFWVTEDGKIADVEFYRINNPVFDEEVIRSIQQMPDWKLGKNTRVLRKWIFTVPVTLQLAEQ